MKRIAVVGGGPAGLMAAIAAAEGETPTPGGREEAGKAGRGLQVTVFDRGVPLATLLRTGGGRCNLTNATFEARDLAAAYPRGAKFLLSAFSNFGARKTMSWFQDRGLALAVEAEGRVFPASRRASEVRDLLLAEADSAGVELRSHCQVIKLTRRGGSFRLTILRAREDPSGDPATSSVPGGNGSSTGTPEGVIESFDCVILATGGDSADPTDSGYRLARPFGHSTSKLRPSLTALATREKWPGTMAGLTLPEARIQAFFSSKKVADERGSLLFTHRGISGPLAFRISSLCAYLPYRAADPLSLTLSIFPDDGLRGLEKRIDTAMARRPRRSIAAIMRGLAPRPLAAAVIEQSGVPASRQAAQASRDDRAALAQALESLPLTVIAAEKEGEIVTAGGIELHLVDQKSMESRIVPKLFFCGELLDIDGFTGGYNLQAAWTTGRLAGLAARRRALAGRRSAFTTTALSSIFGADAIR